MSKIKDKAKRKIAEILVRVIKADRTSRQTEIDAVDQVLSIPEIAIVDRETELPEIPNIEYQRGVVGHIKRGMEYMVKKGYVKEVKE